MSCGRLGFNSIVVRLKVGCDCPFGSSQGSFNSIVVRLKDLRRVSAEYVLRCFNSIVVRLKALATSTKAAIEYLFQFHSGSIKR